MSELKETVKLEYKGQTIELPVIRGTEGPDVIDIRSLYAKLGMFTFDPGFMSTASCESQITFIDGDEGRLLYRGYPIQDLVERCNYLEIAYLLIYGELPSPEQKKGFEHDITYHTLVHVQMESLFNGFRRDAHPMAIMVGVVGALSAFYHDSTDVNDPMQRQTAIHRLIAKMPTLAAMAYNYSMGRPFTYPKNDLSYAANFLRMTFFSTVRRVCCKPSNGTGDGSYFNPPC